MAEYNTLYQRAIYYDIVFNRDVSSEITFFRELFCQRTGRDLRSLIDIACGPGYHARAAARAGLRAVGLDLRGEMLRYAGDQASAEGLSVEWVEADMRTIRLSEPVDMALSMFDSIDALQSDDDIIAHFRAMADNLTPGGLYALELSHSAGYHYELYPHLAYHGEREGVAVDIYWATNRPQFDLTSGVAHVEIEMHVNDHGQETIIHDSADERLLCPSEVRLLARLSGAFDLVAWYGDTHLGQPLDHTPMSTRMIGVMQKR